MATLKFKTNINCSSCVRSVTPILDRLANVEKWEVDTEVAEKVLTVEGDGLTPEAVVQAVAKVGFDATPLN